MTNSITRELGPLDVTSRATAPHQRRAVDYLRVSTEEQRLGYGIASQARKNSRHIADKGWAHISTYADEGVSGSKEMGERPDFDRLMVDAERREFDVVVVERGDRIGRVGRAFCRWVWALEDIGIFVAITNRNIDNTTPEGRAQMRREADYAETEWENIRSRTQGGLQEKAEEGGSPHIGGRPPYGYRIEDKGLKGSYLVVDEGEAGLVRLVHGLMVESGLNLRQAAIRLNAAGHTCRSGRPWSVANLRDRVLSRAVLDGEVVFRGRHAIKDADGNPIWGETVAIPLPRILGENEAAALRRASGTRKNSSSHNHATYSLSGRLIGLCGAPYTGISRESVAAGRRNYRCSGKNDRIPGEAVCDCSYVDAEVVEQRVWSEVVALFGDSQRLTALAAEWVGLSNGDRTAHADRIADLDKQVDSMKASIAAVIVASAKEQQPPDAIVTATRALNEELRQLEEMRADAAAWLAEVEEADQHARDLKALAGMAHHQLTDIPLWQQGQILTLLDVKVHIEGPVPVRRGGAPCNVQAWYASAGLDIPAADLSDKQWESIRHLLPQGYRERVRRSVDAIFAKARTGLSWPNFQTKYGSTSTCSKYFVEWSTNGSWAKVNAALAEVERVPLPVLDLMPPVRIEGRVDPRVILIPDGQSPTLSRATTAPYDPDAR